MRLTVIPLLLMILPASAGELPSDDMVRTMMLHERAPVATLAYLNDPLSLEATSVDIGTTPLLASAEALGSEITNSGKGNYAWTCVTRAGEAVWLISQATDEGGEPLVTSIVRTAAAMDGSLCTSNDRLGFSSMLPSPGASLSSIEAVLGPNENSDNEVIAYQTQDTLGDGGGSWLVIATVSYHITDGVADAVAYDVMTVR